MRFGNFLFSESRIPERDGEVIHETLREAELCEALGVDVIWLAEHHFDGNCAYVDPVTFAAAIAMRTVRATIGFAVAQVSLHHPVRLAEEIALLDQLTHGRLIVGLGRGTAYNIYEYQGYGLDAAEAQARYAEAEAVMVGAWTTENFVHSGKFWQVRIPQLRPLTYTKPHPLLIHGSSTEHSLIDLAQKGLPFLMNVQSNETTRSRVAAYRAAMRESGFDEAHVARCLAQSWIWRNIFVADTDAEADRIGPVAFDEMTAHRTAMRRRILEETGATMPAPKTPAHTVRAHSLICGSPDTVAEAIAELDQIGVGGLLMQTRLGPMPEGVAEQSLRLFMERVAPQFRAHAAAA